MDKKRKEEEEIIKNPQKGRINILATLDKDKLRKIVKACPKRTSVSLTNMCEHLKKETNNLKDEEKSYVVFYWMCENIKYDVQGYLSGNRQVEPEQTYRNGYSVCSGYSRLFKHIGIYRFKCYMC